MGHFPRLVREQAMVHPLIGPSRRNCLHSHWTRSARVGQPTILIATCSSPYNETTYHISRDARWYKDPLLLSPAQSFPTLSLSHTWLTSSSQTLPNLGELALSSPQYLFLVDNLYQQKEKNKLSVLISSSYLLIMFKKIY